MQGKDLSAFHAIVRGQVQGVGFRYTARNKAAELRLTGWVRNCDDGTVEVVAEGPREQLEAFERWLRKGPPGSWVTDVDLHRGPPEGRYRSFSIEF